MRELFEAVKQTVDVTEFYDIYRPLLAGWTAQPRGAIILDGVKSLPGLAPLGTTLPTVISYHNFESEGTHHPESRAPADSVASDPICNRGGADWAAMAAAGLLRCTADREVVCTAAGGTMLICMICTRRIFCSACLPAFSAAEYVVCRAKRGSVNDVLIV
eukprot:SAG31_NODE_841_length_11595_cov_3.739388_8_plen_160_part_00